MYRGFGVKDLGFRSFLSGAFKTIYEGVPHIKHEDIFRIAS